ncbi:carcinoembryonic antigen-related cell adhesion molecule 6-like [Paralichthys olivaceus]|uniref:carcinoembryonic antigen-related cell adhesion molecule 6-like n=1 Tax=Paralichthys olivaceus TaxID=8255 RepID=UPI0037526783
MQPAELIDEELLDCWSVTEKSFSMFTEHRNLTWTLRLLLLSGVFCKEWNVKYQDSVCAVKGSAVVIPCSFDYPEKEKVKDVMWGHEKYNIFEGPFIWTGMSNDSSRFQYIGNKLHNCSLIIKQVEHNDTGKYAFRFITKSKNGKWTGAEGSILKIVDLQTVVTNTDRHGAIKEGDSVNVTCRKSCDGGNISSAFIWIKNGKSIYEGPSLYWRDISPANSGNYTCSLKAHSETTSGVVNINVEYGPKNTSGSVRPSTEVDDGSNFILTCSSSANPPVENYTWFKVDDDKDIKIVGDKSELHFREVSVAAGGRYLCSATNRHGSQNSTIVTLKVKAHFPYIFILATAAAALLIVAAVIAVTRFNKKRAEKPEADHVEDQQETPSNTLYLNWPRSENSNEGNQCEEQNIECVYTTIDFNTKRKSNMRRQMDSHNNDEGVIYSMVQFPLKH